MVLVGIDAAMRWVPSILAVAASALIDEELRASFAGPLTVVFAAAVGVLARADLDFAGAGGGRRLEGRDGLREAMKDSSDSGALGEAIPIPIFIGNL